MLEDDSSEGLLMEPLGAPPGSIISPDIMPSVSETQSLLGRRVRCYWPAMAAWFDGVLHPSEDPDSVNNSTAYCVRARRVGFVFTPPRKARQPNEICLRRTSSAAQLGVVLQIDWSHLDK